MRQSPSRLSEPARIELSNALNALLADGLDLYSQIKVAHWNVKGPQFAALHPLFESFAVALAGFTDDMAERAVTLGSLAFGTARHVAKTSRLPEYPQQTTRDLDHVRNLVERFEQFLDCVRGARDVAEKVRDQDTVDQLTAVVRDFEKNAWFLRATLDG